MKCLLKTPLLILWTTWSLAACTYGDYAQPDIVPAKQRRAQAIKAFEDRLLQPADGWATRYNPNEGRKKTADAFDEAGRDYKVHDMLLKFAKDGTVNIRSKLKDQGGIYENHTIDWRVELRQMPVLVLETYGIFHYLAEKVTENVVIKYPDGYVVTGSYYFLSRAEFEFGYDKTQNKGDTLQLISFTDRVNEGDTTSMTKLFPATKKNFQDFGL